MHHVCSTCGDGAKDDIVEECDDGNSIDGDGCSAACKIETGWACSGAPCEESSCSTVCGNNDLCQYTFCNLLFKIVWFRAVTYAGLVVIGGS